MRGDSKENMDREIYSVKCVPPYCTEEFKKRVNEGKKFSRRQLIEAERYALIESFEECFEDLKNTVKFRGDELPRMIWRELKRESI